MGFVVHQVEGTLVLTNVGGDVACPGEKIVLTCRSRVQYLAVKVILSSGDGENYEAMT